MEQQVGPINNQLVVNTNTDAGHNAVDNNNDENPFGPIMVNGVYNPKAHHYHVQKQFERDLTIPNIVDELGEDACKFVEVETKLGGTQIHLTFHPNPTAEVGADLKWISLACLAKNNAGRFFKEISNKRLHWNHKVLSGDISSFISTTFEQDLVEGTYNSNLAEFAKKAAKFILDHPHESIGTYGCYLVNFLNLIHLADDQISNLSLQRIAVAIAVGLKRVADYNDRNLSEMDLYKKIRNIPTKPTIQDCSKSVHYKLSLIDLNAQKASNKLEELDKAAAADMEAERLAKQARMDAIKTAMANAKNSKLKALESPVEERKKRKIEEIKNDEEVSGEESTKRRKLDTTTTVSSKDLLFNADNKQ